MIPHFISHLPGVGSRPFAVGVRARAVFYLCIVDDVYTTVCTLKYASAAEAGRGRARGGGGAASSAALRDRQRQRTNSAATAPRPPHTRTISIDVFAAAHGKNKCDINYTRWQCHDAWRRMHRHACFTRPTCRGYPRLSLFVLAANLTLRGAPRMTSTNDKGEGGPR